MASSTNITQESQRSPVRERRATEYTAAVSPSLESSPRYVTVILRKLPRNIGNDGLRNMLLFAKDMVATYLIDSTPDDNGFATAIARFNSYNAAREVQECLNGKMNASQDSKMIVQMADDMSAADSGRLGVRRSTIDGTAARTDQITRQPSRYNSTFQSADKISPPLPMPGQSAENSSHFHTLFSPTSPVSNSTRDRQQNIGKSVINDDVADDDTDGILRDPLGYARNGRQITGTRPPMPHIPTSQFSNLSLGSNNYHEGVSPGSGSNTGLPNTPSQNPLSGQDNFFASPMSPQNYYNQAGRVSYPPANPADQNPPCNTLYVGNLPNNTSEDELKRLFSQQRGYKRLCFRTKQNGPMCFVEFETVTLATQALNLLYGKMLSNSIKGGIRLSFSKNPLGVRNGQNPLSPNPMMMPNGPYGGFGNDITPPPGFNNPSTSPPGIMIGANVGGMYLRDQMNDPMGPMYQAQQYSMSSAPFASQLRVAPQVMYGGRGAPSPNGGPPYFPQYYENLPPPQQ